MLDPCPRFPLIPFCSSVLVSKGLTPQSSAPMVCDHLFPARFEQWEEGRNKDNALSLPFSLPRRFLWQQLHLPHECSFCHLTPAHYLPEQSSLSLPLAQEGSSFLLPLIMGLTLSYLVPLSLHQLFNQFLMLTLKGKQNKTKPYSVLSGVCLPVRTLTAYTMYTDTYMYVHSLILFPLHLLSRKTSLVRLTKATETPLGS